ncbi:MAG: transcription antitermination factor NusB [Acidimicrobiales bacterium]
MPGPSLSGPETPAQATVGIRRQARERALTLLYEAEAKSVGPEVVLAGLPVAPDGFTVDLVAGVAANGDEIDGWLRRFARGWALKRMPAIDRTLVRIGVFESLHRPDVPTAVVISEAVDLAHRCSTDDSGRFVNGVLAAVAAEARPPGPGAISSGIR